MIVAAATVPVAAQQENVTEHVWIELDGGAFTKYDDSGLWGSGLGGGVTGLWGLNTTTLLGARFSVTQWSYESSFVVPGLVPAGSELTSEHSSGDVQMVSLTPVIRYQREEVMGRLGAFVAGGLGVAYMKQFARSEITYFPPSQGAAQFELDESAWKASIEFLAGLRRPVSSSSWLELMATYRTVLAGETANIVGGGVAFNMRV